MLDYRHDVDQLALARTRARGYVVSCPVRTYLSARLGQVRHALKYSVSDAESVDRCLPESPRTWDLL